MPTRTKDHQAREVVPGAGDAATEALIRWPGEATASRTTRRRVGSAPTPRRPPQGLRRASRRPRRAGCGTATGTWRGSRPSRRPAAGTTRCRHRSVPRLIRTVDISIGAAPGSSSTDVPGGGRGPRREAHGHAADRDVDQLSLRHRPRVTAARIAVRWALRREVEKSVSTMRRVPRIRTTSARASQAPESERRGDVGAPRHPAEQAGSGVRQDPGDHDDEGDQDPGDRVPARAPRRRPWGSPRRSARDGSAATTGRRCRSGRGRSAARTRSASAGVRGTAVAVPHMRSVNMAVKTIRNGTIGAVDVCNAGEHDRGGDQEHEQGARCPRATRGCR